MQTDQRAVARPDCRATAQAISLSFFQAILRHDLKCAGLNLPFATLLGPGNLDHDRRLWQSLLQSGADRQKRPALPDVEAAVDGEKCRCLKK